MIEQKQLIRELDLMGQHLAQLEAEMIHMVGTSREGKILTSIPGIGPLAAATLIALSGNIANFERASQRKLVGGLGPKGSTIGVHSGLDTLVAAWGQTDETDDVSHRVEGYPMG